MICHGNALAVAAVVLAGLAACAAPGPSTQTLGGDVVIGADISCAGPVMERHCDAWLSSARQTLSDDASAPSGAVEGWSLHAGSWKDIAGAVHTTHVVAVVVFHLSGDRQVNVPVWCSVYLPGEPGCDLTDVPGG